MTFLKYVLHFDIIFVFFYRFWLLLGQFWQFLKALKNHEIQDGRSKMATLLEPDVVVTSYDVFSLCCGLQRKHFLFHYLSFKLRCHSLNILGFKRWGPS